MTPDAWKRMIGEDVWERLIEAGYHGVPDDALAAILTTASEAGFTAPARAPKINRSGTVASWAPGVLALTAEGLRRYWAAKGHGFILLRVEQLLKALDGPLLPRLQELLLAYEEQCAVDGKPPLPLWADISPFVGGKADPAWPQTQHPTPVTLHDGLYKESPTPETGSTVTIASPGATPEYR